jgi:glycosyltransferase involved in cell wall biosynthesis
LVAQLGAMAGRLGVEERVTLAGARDHREVAALLPAFDVMVLPGVTEFSSPLKLHEWMAASLAIVAADLPNLREVLEHDRNCLLVPAGDAGALTAAVLALASDPRRRTRLGEAARADVVSRGLTWDSNARAVVAAVEEIRRRQAG